tara:strand:- start:128 stop:415 length:288 start_codon:yes stop_codon:yes gene_type:complete
MSDDKRKELHAALGKLEATRRAAHKHRDALVGRAQQQLDTIHKPVEGWQKEVESSGGGILPLRRLKTVARERQRLLRITGDHDTLRRAQDAPESL